MSAQRTAVLADIAAERTLLGAVLVNPDVLSEAAALLTPADFYREQHRRIFASMLRLDAGSVPIDAVTLAGDLQKHDELEAAGGGEGIGALMDGLPRVSSLAHWAGSIRREARIRALVVKAERVKARAFEGDATPEELEAMLTDVGPDNDGDGILDRGNLARSTWELLDAEVSGTARGIPTGLPTLSRMLRFQGWRPGQLVYVGARTSRGKSALLLQFAEAAAEAKKRVLMFSLEMGAEDLCIRRLCADAGVGLRSVTSWNREERETALARLTASAGILQRPLDFAAPGIRTIGRIRAECKRAARRGLDLVVVDYLGLVRHEAARRQASLYETNTLVSQDLKALAVELGVPFLVAVQLNRETAAGGRPGLAHFRDSGAIEQDCDVALLIHQADTTDALREGRVELIVAKQRNGQTGDVGLWWNGPCVRFEDLATRSPVEAA